MSFQSLNRLLKTLEQRPSPKERQFQRVLQAWTEIVGDCVAAQTRPLRIQQGVLQVATSSSAWAQNLVFERQRILDKLNPYLVTPLTDIRFSTAQWVTAAPAPTNPGEEQQTHLWQNHPSRFEGQISSTDHSSADATDAISAFQHWAKTQRSRSQQMPLCPACQCPTPSGELERWQVCAHCITKKW
jgi:predicted nucleic acid-binding Zn ribbon protein